jgi:hypothetical protein
VNSTETDVFPAHDIVERGSDGQFTVRYREGSKKGLEVHFFSEVELRTLFAQAFTVIVPLREQVTSRESPDPGQWTQWEAIRRRVR